MTNEVNKSPSTGETKNRHGTSSKHGTSPVRVNFVEIPQELKASCSFCVWKLEKRSGKPTKVPYNPKNGQMAKTNDASTFAGFPTVMKAYAMGGYDGIGFRVSDGHQRTLPLQITHE